MKPSQNRSWLRIGLFAIGFSACLVVAGAMSAAASESSPSVASDIELPRVVARFAIHGDFDRLVFKLPPPVKATFRQDGATLKLQFAGSGDLTGNAVFGRRLLSMVRGQSEAVLQLAPNVRVRTWRSGDLLVIDAFDPNTPVAGLSAPGSGRPTVTRPLVAPANDAGAARALAPKPIAQGAASAASPAPKTDFLVTKMKAPVPATRSGDLARSVSESPLPSDAVSAEPEPKRAPDAQATAHPVSVTLVRDSGSAGPALLVPFGRDVGAAAFGRGSEGRVVFDAPQTFDLSELKDDTSFSGVTEQLFPDGMQLRLRMAAGYGLSLLRRDDGWLISIQPPGPAASLSPINGQNRKGVTAFDAAAAGHVVVVNDELTGGRLLVGTQRVQGQHVGGAHVSAEAAILPTWQGLVVEPASDRVLLRARPAGFELSTIDAPPLAMTWSDQQTGAWPDGRTMTRLFDFSDAPAEALHRRLGQALRDAAAAPKLARFGPRLGVAQAMLAQGMDVEAASVLRAAGADDPAGRDRRCAGCLAALASWMSARAGGIESPDMPLDGAKFGDSDEAGLLKAVLRPSSADITGQAAVAASTWPLLLSYPVTLRRFMLEPVANLLLRGGQDKALAAFLAAFPDPSLDLARAGFLQSKGKLDDSLRLYDRVAAGRDRLARANALEQAVLARLAAKRMSPASAAAALNNQLYAWRGGDRELRMRQSIAKLRGQAGEWRGALMMLAETQQQFPQSHAEIQAAKSALVAELLKGDNVAKLSAIDLVAIADTTSDVLDGDVAFAPALIDKLLALDLASRADPLLRRMFQSAKDPKTKAELGVRLAGSMLDQNDPAAALAVLAASDDSALGAAIVSRRALLRARLLAQSGKPADALEALADIHSPEASTLKASIMEGRHDWAGAAGVLKPLLADAGFAAMPQTEQCSLVLRLARDEAEAGDQAGLHELHQTQAAQFKSGPNAALFAVLTAEPVRSTADLPRSATEVRALQSIPAAIARARPF